MNVPRLTPSMRSALADLELDRLVVMYPGQRRYPLADHVEVLPLRMLAQPDAAGQLLGDG